MQINRQNTKPLSGWQGDWVAMTPVVAMIPVVAMVPVVAMIPVVAMAPVSKQTFTYPISTKLLLLGKDYSLQ